MLLILLQIPTVWHDSDIRAHLSGRCGVPRGVQMIIDRGATSFISSDGTTPEMVSRQPLEGSWHIEHVNFLAEINVQA